MSRHHDGTNATLPQKLYLNIKKPDWKFSKSYYKNVCMNCFSATDRVKV